MNDDPQDTAGDDPGPHDGLSPADESFVSGLLAALPAAPMPAAVAARIDAALAQLPPLAAPAGPGGTPTVVPFAAPARPAATWRSPRVLQVAAAVVLVVGAGVVGVKVVSGHTTSAPSASSGAASTGLVVTESNRAYSAAALAPQVRALVSGSPAAMSAGQSPAAPVPGPVAPLSTAATSGRAAVAAPSGTGALDPTLRALTASTTALAPCIAAIEDGLATYVAPVAIDAGTYDGAPALIVVLPARDPGSYDVWIVGPGCGANKDAALISYQLVPRR